MLHQGTGSERPCRNPVPMSERTLPTPGAALLLLACVLAFPTSAGASDDAWFALLGSADTVEQMEWAQRFEHAEGVPRDMDRAVQLYCAAALRGDARAQYQLGWVYANGRGVARDDALAAAWFQLAAAQGDEHAARMLPRVDTPGTRKPALCVSPGNPAGRPWFASGGLSGREGVERAVRIMAPGYGLDPDLVLLVIEAESAFNPTARSHKGALGLMQLMPATAARFGVDDPLDPLQNLRGGMAYLEWLLERYDGRVMLALAGYNAGEAAVDRFGGVPPYAETRGYVKRITRAYGRQLHRPVAAAGASVPTA